LIQVAWSPSSYPDGDGCHQQGAHGFFFFFWGGLFHRSGWLFSYRLAAGWQVLHVRVRVPDGISEWLWSGRRRRWFVGLLLQVLLYWVTILAARLWGGCGWLVHWELSWVASCGRRRSNWQLGGILVAVHINLDVCWDLVGSHISSVFAQSAYMRGNF